MRFVFTVLLVTILTYTGAGQAAMAAPVHDVVALDGNALRQGLQDQFTRLSSLDFGGQVPNLDDASSGASVDTEMVLSLSQSEAEDLAAQAPAKLLGATRYVVALDEQAMVVDVAVGPLGASYAVHLVRSVSGAGEHMPEFVTVDLVGSLGEYRAVYSENGRSGGVVQVSSDAGPECSESCNAGSFAGGLIGGIGCGLLIGGGTVVPVIGNVAGGIMCGVLVGTLATGGGVVCNAACTPQNEAFVQIDAVTCNTYECGVHADVVVLSGAHVVSGTMLVEWQRLKTQTYIITFHSMSAFTHVRGSKYALSGLAYDNQGTPVRCTGRVAINVTAQASNRSLAQGNISVNKPFDADCSVTN